MKWGSRASRRAASRLNYGTGGGDVMVEYWRGIGRGDSVRRVMSGEGQVYTSVWLYETCISMTLINMVSPSFVLLQAESVLSYADCALGVRLFVVPFIIVAIILLDVVNGGKNMCMTEFVC